MRLLNDELQINLILEENKIQIIVAEDKNTYVKILFNLYKQIKGEEGGFILSSCEKEVPLSKKALLIFNPFEISCNEKKIINKLYQDIKDISIEYFQEETAQMNSNNILFLDKLLAFVPYNLGFDLDVNINDFLKIMNVHIDEVGESLLEKIVEYIKIQSRICGIELFIFVGLKRYFEESDLECLYKELHNEKVFLIDVEADANRLMHGENVFIIDKDNCIIEVNN